VSYLGLYKEETKIKIRTKRALQIIKSPSAESRAKSSSSQLGIPKPQKIVQCPYCKKAGALNNMNRWHFNNCTSK